MVAQPDAVETQLHNVHQLNIRMLSTRHPGLTQSVGDSYTEAASVCLSQHHGPPCEINVECPGTLSTCTGEWDVPDNRTKGAWTNEIDTTEAGAYGVSLAAVELLKGLVAVRRAEQRTGADYYYLLPIGQEAEDLNSCIRLEVSGTYLGNKAEIRRRLTEKIAQTDAGASNLPAIANVVGVQGTRQVMISDQVEQR